MLYEEGHVWLMMTELSMDIVRRKESRSFSEGKKKVAGFDFFFRY